MTWSEPQLYDALVAHASGLVVDGQAAQVTVIPPAPPGAPVRHPQLDAAWGPRAAAGATEVSWNSGAAVWTWNPYGARVSSVPADEQDARRFLATVLVASQTELGEWASRLARDGALQICENHGGCVEMAPGPVGGTPSEGPRRPYLPMAAWVPRVDWLVAERLWTVRTEGVTATLASEGWRVLVAASYSSVHLASPWRGADLGISVDGRGEATAHLVAMESEPSLTDLEAGIAAVRAALGLSSPATPMPR